MALIYNKGYLKKKQLKKKQEKKHIGHKHIGQRSLISLFITKSILIEQLI